ncbi:MAG: hypothetical protein WCI11_18700 [Candidatus Methylumidiphilus sp.]
MAGIILRLSGFTAGIGVGQDLPAGIVLPMLAVAFRVDMAADLALGVWSGSEDKCSWLVPKLLRL